MGPTVVRSSLEVMLDSLRKKDENPEDSMPTLPARPVSKGRLPSFRRSLPAKFNIESIGFNNEQKKVPAAPKTTIFGGKKISNVQQPEESPYSEMLPELDSWHEIRRDEATGSPSISPGTGDREKLDYVVRKDLRVWYCLADGKWKQGDVQSISGDVAHVKSSDDKVLTISTENLLPANPEILDSVGDFIQLSYLNEPSVIHNLQSRYSRDMIYTKAGPVLVSVNPFKEVPLYGNDFVAAYSQKKHVDSPHVFAVADTAYNQMMKDGKNQSIILSGESGAGKTETAKFAMQYLAALGSDNGIEEEVLQTNVILESFGNVKTLRNDNSSRFGKLIEIQFSVAGKICGAKIQTFLLEKSRVVQRANGERSYHVLYQLCAGASPHLREKLKLKTADEYEYLKQSNCLTIADVDDAQRFHMLMEALDVVKISKEDQENAFAMLATVLWLGNIGFSMVDDENHVEVDLSEGVTNAAKLMDCEVSNLMRALSTRTCKEGIECSVQKLTLSEAIDTRDALAKSIYSSLFDWLVEKLNISLDVGKGFVGRSISILDIYGFESFNRNSFEQLCINYANERLQQHFNRHLFKLEQEEYSQNGIDWNSVDFVDNIECLNLFEKKTGGLFSLLDEESALLKATDITLANKLKQQLSGNACFKGERGGAFRICHFAGEVLYNTMGFLEKNRDFLHSDCIKLLSSCSSQLPCLFARMHNQQHNPVTPLQKLHGTAVENNIGTNFKGQLFKLMQQLESTTPHFIRCIKPNDQHLPGSFDNDLVLRQLRYCGVLDVVRISRSGYPTRMTHQQFAERYGFCLLRDTASHDPLSVSVNVLQHFNALPDMYQVGYMKILFRSGQIASLEEARHRTLQGILCVQKHFRGLKARRYFQEIKHGVVTLQSFIRGCLERENFSRLKCSKISKTGRAKANSGPDPKLLEFVDTNKEQPQVPHAVVEDFQKQILMAETELRIKEEENLTLKQQIQEYETNRADYEAKMKSMQEMWQKQMTSLQTSLTAARKSLAADEKQSQPGRYETSPSNRYFDSEDAMSDFPTPESTPAKQSHAPAAILPRNPDNTWNTVNHMVKEFEQQKKVLEDDARFIIEVKSGQSHSNTNPDEELQKLKARFTSWKKDYKVKLRGTKIELQKLSGSELAKTRRKWWNIRTSK